MSDADKAYALLRCVEADLNKFLTDGEAIDPMEYFEDVHIALVEAMTLLGVEIDPDDEFEFDGLVAEYEKQQNAIALEDFDPINNPPKTN